MTQLATDSGLGAAGIAIGSAAYSQASSARDVAIKALRLQCGQTYDVSICDDVCYRNTQLSITPTSITRAMRTTQLQNVCKEELSQPPVTHNVIRLETTLLPFILALLLFIVAAVNIRRP